MGASERGALRAALAVLGVGCAAATASAPPGGGAALPAAATLSLPAPPPALDVEAEPIAAPPPPPDRCYPKGRPPPAPPPRLPAPLPCRARDPGVEQPLAALLASRYRPTGKGSRIDVRFGCDWLEEGIRRVVIERGALHARTLEIWQLTRAEARPPRYDVVGIAYERRPMHWMGEPLFQVARGALLAADVEAALPEVRAALVAEMREVFPRLPRMRWGFMRGSPSHTAVRVEDAAGRAIELRHVGQETSGKQGRFLPAQRALERLAPLLEPFSWERRPADEGMRALFTERFLLAEESFRELGAWWTPERWAGLSRWLGTPALIPSLLRLLPIPPEKKDDSRAQDNREAALAALAALTGWDARVAADGTKRSPEEAARDYLEACGEKAEP